MEQPWQFQGHALKKRGQNEENPQRKLQFFLEADRSYRQAVSLGKTTSNLRLQQFYRDWANNCVWLKDTATFLHLVTVDFIYQQEKIDNVEDIIKALNSQTKRMKELMKPFHIEAVLQTLKNFYMKGLL